VLRLQSGVHCASPLVLNPALHSRRVSSAHFRNHLSVPSLSSCEGRIAPMTDRRPRSSYESDWLPYTKVTARSAVRAAIGEALRSRSEVPEHLPHEMLSLLMQVNALREGGGK